MNRPVKLQEWPPRRIISLVPSQTELLADLDLETEVVGITKFCIHPDNWFRNKTRIGGTKTLNIEKIRALVPDLIIGNKEENEQSQIEILEKEFPVWMSDITQLEEAIEMIRSLGEICHRQPAANEIAAIIELEFNNLKKIPTTKPISVVYLIWRKPFMAAGTGTFIHSMLQAAGFENVLSDQQRYPELSPAQLAEIQPAVIFLSSEPYPFAEKHIAELQSLCPNSEILLVDGELFSWYGSRLKLAPTYFQNLREMLK